jgi:hypothetical protein
MNFWREEQLPLISDQIAEHALSKGIEQCCKGLINHNRAHYGNVSVKEHLQ